jgi:hypothetical protein
MEGFLTENWEIILKNQSPLKVSSPSPSKHLKKYVKLILNFPRKIKLKKNFLERKNLPPFL